MKILIIDGQGGGVGRSIVAALKAAMPAQPGVALGTNAQATAAMLKAGADLGATGEGAIRYQCKSADIILGVTGILHANAMLGEITEKMALAIGRSGAKKLLLPVNQCGNLIAGTQAMSLSRVMEEAVALLKELLA